LFWETNKMEDKDKEQQQNELMGLPKKITELENIKTSQKQTEKKLVKFEELYRLIAENTSDVITLHDFNLQATYRYINPSIKDIGGYESEELLGKSPFDFIHPDDKNKLFSVLKNYIDDKVKKLLTGKKLPITKRIEFRFKDKEGNWRNFQSTGNIVGNQLLFITRDITENIKIEKELRENQQILLTLMNNLPGMSYRCQNDRDWTMKFVSEGCMDLTGYKPEEITNNKAISFGQLIHKDDQDYVWNDVQAGLKDKKNYKLIYRIKTAEGKEKWVWEQAQGVFSADGKLLRIEGFITDITERKLAEEKLHKSQEEFASLFNSNPEALVYLDKKGIILDANLRFCKLFGYSLKEIKGRNIDDGMIHPSYKIEEGKKLSIKGLEGYLNYETIRKKKDETLFPVSISATPLEIDGHAKGEIGIYIDITERKKSEEELRQSEEKFAGIFKSIPEAAFYQDTKGTILDINPRFTKVFGYTKKEVLGKNIDKIGLYPKGKMKEGKDLTRKTLNEDLTNFETVRQNKDGTLIPVRISTSFVKIKDKVTGLIGLYQDITESKQNEKLQQVLYNISKAANSPISIKQLYKTIHKELGNIIDTTNFYIALLDEKKDNIFFPYHVDEEDDNFPISNFSTSNTLTTYVIKTGRSLLNDNNQYKEMISQGILSPMGSTTDKSIWLGIPLKIKDKVIGAMVVQSYTNPKLYSKSDIKLLEFVSSQVATAIDKHLSFHDSLTGLYNRAYFEEELERYNFPRYYPLSVVMLDVNGLKVINDTFGHTEGDRLLQHLSQVLASVSRQGDILARIGGDEFAILLPSTTSEEAHNFCERIKKVCHQDKIEPIYLRLNISLGHTTQEGKYKDMNSLLKEADRNMYQDKLFNGKSREKHFLEAFRIVLSERDPHTSDHARRLQELAISLGKRVGLTEYQLGNLKLLALLHDIGKIGIPDSILFKTYILTPSEWEKMREHSRIGYRMAKNIPDFAPIAQEILYHHEHWNGTGYPDGLKGENIPLLSRIISIVDAYDVMQSRRPYKGPISKIEALKEIKGCAGTQFDPQLVEIFLKIENGKK